MVATSNRTLSILVYLSNSKLILPCPFDDFEVNLVKPFMMLKPPSKTLVTSLSKA